MINYRLIGFTMSYGQPNPSTYYYMVDDRLRIRDVKRYLERWFSWMKVIHIVEPQRDNIEHYILGYFTRKDIDEQTK